MRLLKCLPGNNFELFPFDDDNLPPYAILSHTWIDGEEVTYSELVTDKGKDKTGYSKIRFCAERAAADGLEYFWIDTCCIDKSTSTELSIALNSMFRWYQLASNCYVYLTDVFVSNKFTDAEAFRATWQEAFRRSRWFTRGWTLQELLAPASVEFFSKEGKRLGSKLSLEREIHEITRLPISVLRGQNLSEFSVEERMSWAAARTTTLKEDKVYCLLGIFGVFLPLIYGEGEDYATFRLKQEIQRRQEALGTENARNLSVSSLLPFPRNELFVGREHHLQSLEQYLLFSNTHRRMTIYGLGGCGKSSLALEFAYRTLASYAKSLVFWVPAISQESFELAYREIGMRLSIPGMTDDHADVMKLVKDALSSGSYGDWLMIVDNAEDPEVLLDAATSNLLSAQLIDYLPHSNRSAVLFTTRSRKLASQLTQSNVLELLSMSKTEAMQLLARQVAKQALLDDQIAVDELLEILTHLPLAIVQAVAFINNNDISVSGYVSLFQHAGTEIELFGEYFEDPSRYREMNSTIAKTWYISFEQIRKQDRLAADYLSFMACIDRINIPQSLLLPGDSLVQQAKALGTLTGYAFITERQQTVQNPDKERFFDMHRLVHMASVWWLDDQSERATWMNIASSRIMELLPYDGCNGKKSWTTYLSHALHVAGVDSIVDESTKLSLLSRVGQCQQNLGQYAAAETTQQQLLSLKEKSLGPEHHSTLASMSNLALVLNSRGKYEEAEAMNRQTLAQRKTVLGPAHPSTLISASNLALVLNSQGKYKEAEAINKQALAHEETILGPRHPSTLTSMSNLAGVLSSQGRYEEAEAMNRQTLAQRETVLGPEHPDTLTSMSNLAGVLNSQGNYEEAEAMSRQTLAQRETVLGPEHPDTLTSMSNLAGVLNSQCKYEEAEAVNRLVLARREIVLGPEHPSTLTSMSNLALVLDSQDKHEEASAVNRRTLSLRKKVLGPEHPDTLTSMSNLAGVLDSQGKYEEAEAMNRQTLSQRETVLGHLHPSTLTSMSSLAGVLESQGKYEEAEAVSRQTLTRRETVLGSEHPSTLTSMSNLALILDSQGKYEEAESLNRLTLMRSEKVLGPEHPDTMTSISNLAGVLESQGKYEEAEAMNRRALVQRETVLGLEHPDTLMSVYCLARLLASQHCYKESIALYKRAYNAYCTVFGEDHPNTRVCCEHYAEAKVCAVEREVISTLSLRLSEY